MIYGDSLLLPIIAAARRQLSAVSIEKRAQMRIKSFLDYYLKM